MSKQVSGYSDLAEVLKRGGVQGAANHYGVTKTTIRAHIREQGITGYSARGFASMSPERVIEIARKGGRGIKPENRSFSRSRELAAEAGRKGGLKAAARRKAAAQG